MDIPALLTEYGPQVLAALAALHVFALAVVALTPTPADDAVVNRVYRLVETLAGVVGRAKELPGEKKLKEDVVKESRIDAALKEDKEDTSAD